MCTDRPSLRCFPSPSSFRRVLAAAGIGLMVMFAGASAHAVTFTVNVATDSNSSGGGSGTGDTGDLRYVITQAELAANAGSTIQFASTVTGTISLNAALPAITQNTTITGPGANVLTISGAKLYQVFDVAGGATANQVAITGLTIADGASSTGGAGITVGSRVTLALGGCVVADNVDTATSSSPTSGGGILNEGTLEVLNSTFYGNSTQSSGGAINSRGALSTVTVTNSTFYGNSALDYAGAIGNDGGTLEVLNSTFDDNSAKSDDGGAIYQNGGSWTLANSIFANNSAATDGGIYNVGSGTETNNLFFNNSNGDSNRATNSTTDITGEDPLLLPLGNYGGPTPTILPRPGSPVIGKGTSTGIALDQRGFSVASPTTPDIGAVQTNYSQPASLADIPTSGQADVDLSALGSSVSNVAIEITSGAVNLIGPGADKLTVTGTGSASVFTVNSGAQAAFYGMTITGGGGLTGSGVLNDGTATILDSTITGNSAGSPPNLGRGSGVYNSNGAVLTIIGSTISNNNVLGSGVGGGIYAYGGSLKMFNSTVSGNSATGGSGGGIDSSPNATVVLTDVTVSNNSAADGGGIYNAGALTLNNSIVQENSATTAPDIDNSIGISLANNSSLVNTGTSASTVNLAGLGSYGGTTQTMLPIPGTGTSAICAGASQYAVDQYGVPLTTDQRGFAMGQSQSSYCTGTGQIDAGAVQTDYTAVQFANLGTSNGYSADVNYPVKVPAAPIVSVTENNQNIGGIPITLTFSPTPVAPLTVTGLGPQTTVAGTGATFDTIQVNTAGSYTLSTSFTVGSKTFAPSADLSIVTPVSATVAIPSKTLTAQQLSVSFTPVTATNGAGTLTYSVSPALPSGLNFDSTTGAITGVPTGLSAAPNDIHTVTITDGSGATATGNFALVVNNAVSVRVAVPSEMLTVNHAATSFTPVTATGGTGTLSYSMSTTTPLPAGLSINSTTGAITGTPTTASATATYTVTVTDANGASASAPFSLTVNGSVTATVAVSSVALTVNHAATSFTPVTATGGTGTLSYSMSTTTPLPAGLSINSTTGAITGTPTTASAIATYTVTVTDANGATGTGNFSLTVNSAVTATLAVSSETLTASHAATSFTPVTGSGGTGSLSYSVLPALPAGLSMSSTTGAISGTPTVASAAATYTVTVTDANHATATAGFALTVNAAVAATQVIGSETLTASQSSLSFTPVTGSGGTGSLSYSVLPALPAGLSMSSTTGAISGTPTTANAAATYTVTVTDANHATATAGFALTVNAAVTATQAIPVETLTVNQQASFTPVTGSGGTAPLSYSVLPALPAGLSLNSSTGQITGTQTAVSTAATYTVTVADANKVTASANFSLTVTAAKTSISVASSSTNNTSSVNNTVTFTATITPYIGSTALSPPFPGAAAQVTGSVSFEDNGSAICTAAPVSLTGGIYEATCTTSTLQASPSSHTITATYSGSANYGGSNSSLTQTVSAASSSMTLTSLPNPSIAANPKNVDDVVSLTAKVSPINGSVPLSGTVAFTDNGVAISGCSAVPVNATTGLATCPASFTSYGTHSIMAVYGNDSNYTSSQGTATQEVQDYQLAASPTAAVGVTQGYTNANDPFTPQNITVAATPFGGFTGNLALTCTVAAVTAPQGATLPTCSLGSSTLAIASGSTPQPVALTINAGSGSSAASPGTYNVIVTGVDATTELTHTTAAFTVYVRYDEPSLSLVSGATTGNTSSLNFILPASVGITSFQCATVTGPTLSVSVNPSGLGIGCTFTPGSITAAGTVQSASTTVAISTNVPLSQAMLNHNSKMGGGNTAVEVAGMVGVPLFMLLGFLPGARRTRRIFFRCLGIVFVAVLLFSGVSGCGGGSFTQPKSVSGTTPPGTYNVLVQGTGTDGHMYEAVVTINVTR